MWYANRLTIAALLLALVVGAAGCGKRRESSESTFGNEAESEYVLTVVVDLSGSFSELMAEEGRAYEFLLQVIDRYFRDRIGLNDKLIIAQISANERALLWEGTPTQLRRDFATPEAFRDMLRAKADPRASRVHDALCSAIDYVTGDPAVSGGRAKSAIFVLSDMVEYSADPDASEQRMVRALRNYGKCGGVFGVYYCDQLAVHDWQQRLKEAGIREFHVESEIVGNPSLPSFD